MAVLGLTRRDGLRFFKQAKEAEIPLVASSLAFTTILSVVPFFALALLAMKGLAGAEFLGDKYQAMVVGFFKGTTGQEIGPHVEKILQRITGTGIGITSALALLVTSLRLFLRIEYGINRIWDNEEKRPLWTRALLAAGFYLAIPIGLAIYGGFRSGPLKQIFEWSPVIWDALVIFSILVFLNRFMPSNQVPWKSALRGALFSTVFLIILQLGFSWVAREVFDHSKLYGSLAALPLFCIWAVTAWWIILLGVSLSASLTRHS